MGKIIAKLAANVAFVRAAAVTAAIVLPGLLSLGLRGWIPAHYTFVATLTIGAGYFVVERQKAGAGASSGSTSWETRSGPSRLLWPRG